MRMVIGMALLLVGCQAPAAGPAAPGTAAATQPTATSQATLSGTVSEVSATSNRFLLATGTGPVWVIVTDKTVFSGLGRTTQGVAPLAGLQVGEALSVGYSGAMMKSMPPQIVAERISVIAS